MNSIRKIQHTAREAGPEHVLPSGEALCSGPSASQAAAATTPCHSRRHRERSHHCAIEWRLQSRHSPLVQGGRSTVVGNLEQKTLSVKLATEVEVVVQKETLDGCSTH